MNHFSPTKLIILVQLTYEEHAESRCDSATASGVRQFKPLIKTAPMAQQRQFETLPMLSSWLTALICLAFRHPSHYVIGK